MHHTPTGPPFSARAAAALTRWGLRLRALFAPLRGPARVLHRSRVLVIAVAGLVIGSLGLAVPALSTAERQAGNVSLSSSAGTTGTGPLAPTTEDWTTGGSGTETETSRGDRKSTAATTSDPKPTPEPEPEETPESTAETTPAETAAAETAAESSTATTATPSAGGSSASSSTPGTTTPSSRAPSSSAGPETSTATAPSGTEGQVLALVNQERAAAGCPAVAADAGLAAVARAHSADMRDRGYFDHVNLEGLDPFDRAERAGVTNARAENIARGQADAAAVMAGWMNSPGHRANILNCELRTLGVGVATGSGGPWWTQLFGV